MRVGRRCRPSSTLATTNCRSTTRPSWKRSRASSEDMLNKWAPATAALCRRFGGALPSKRSARRQAPLRWTRFRLRRLPASTAQSGRPLGGRNYRRRLPRPQSLQRRAAPPLDRAGSLLQRRSSVLPIRLLRPSPRQRELALPLQREATLPLQRPGLSAKRASADPTTPTWLSRGSTRSCGRTSGKASDFFSRRSSMATRRWGRRAELLAPALVRSSRTSWAWAKRSHRWQRFTPCCVAATSAGRADTAARRCSWRRRVCSGSGVARLPSSSAGACLTRWRSPAKGGARRYTPCRTSSTRESICCSRRTISRYGQRPWRSCRRCRSSCSCATRASG
mmetsp:Transcript_24146/g.77932  ORF Transcript_24146/g.77932 Transcript_24146/m.77932 type:complete len:336 (+) Transcript_24146:281-1288(+)